MALFLKKKCFQLLSFEGSLCPAFLGLTLQELSPHALYMRHKEQTQANCKSQKKSILNGLLATETNCRLLCAVR